MKLEVYRRLIRIVAFSTGLVTAVGVTLNNLFIPFAGITAGMLVLYAAKQWVEERDRDERTAAINQRASQATISITVATLAFVGLGLMLLSRQGFIDFEQLGFHLATTSLFMMSVKAFFDWYYRNRLGG